jgi:quinol monooxygenase YgiN
MSELAYIVKVRTAEGKRDEALAALGPLVDAVEGEEGTLVYVVHADGTDPDVIWFYERYADQASFEAHTGSPAMAELGGKMVGLLAGTPEMSPVEVVRSKGEPG